MDGWCEEGFEELGCGYLENRGARTGWLEKVFRAGQVPQRVVVPIIIIIITWHENAPFANESSSHCHTIFL
jgi:hypothetical protein